MTTYLRRVPGAPPNSYMGGQIFANRKMMHNAELTNTIPTEHFGGRKGYHATYAVLTKRLILDNLPCVLSAA